MGGAGPASTGGGSPGGQPIRLPPPAPPPPPAPAPGAMPGVAAGPQALRRPGGAAALPRSVGVSGSGSGCPPSARRCGAPGRTPVRCVLPVHVRWVLSGCWRWPGGDGCAVSSRAPGLPCRQVPAVLSQPQGQALHCAAERRHC